MEHDLTCACGYPQYETTDPDGPDYNALPVRCRACEAKETAARAKAGIDDEDPSAGIKWRIVEDR